MLPRHSVLAIAALLLLTPPAAFTQTPKPSPSKKKTTTKAPPKNMSSGQAKIEAALKQKSAYDFKDTPLREVLSQIAKREEIPVYLDERKLLDREIALDRPVTYPSKSVALAEALDQILDPLQIAWLVRWDVLFITTKIDAAQLLETRVYRLLTPVSKDRRNFMTMLKEDIEPQTWEDVGGPATVMPVRNLQSKTPLGNPGVLVVRQSQPVHRRIGPQFKQILEAVIAGDRSGLVGIPGLDLPKALDEVPDVTFDARPLTEAVAEIRKRQGVKITIDEKALAEGKHTVTVPVSWSLQGVRLSSLLTLMLSQSGLTWTVDEGAIVVTTPAAAARRMISASYPAKELLKAVTGNVSGKPDFNSLLNAISGTIAPDSWEGLSGPGRIQPGTKETLQVEQSFWVQQDVARLLVDLRAGLQSVKR